MPEREPCRSCGAGITANRAECPECGYNPRRTMTRVGAVLVVIGAASVPFVGDVGVAVSLVGAVLFVWSAIWATPTR